MTALVRDRVDDAAGPDHDGFRAELRAFLQEHPPPNIAVAATAEDVEALRDWQRALRAGGWVGVHWPVEHGGRGASPARVVAYNEELARAGAPPLPGRVGVTLVGPTLIAHGTDEQRRRWMPRILSGDDLWCQLFSEPDAGSDLTSLSTRAERRGGSYIVTGQKVWSSHAQFAEWGIALVRTGSDPRGARGISMLAVPMTAAGVEVRPLRQITGDCEFNEVFFDAVEVSVANRIGAEGGGWAVANTTLANERGASFIWREQVLHELAFERLVGACAPLDRTGDPLLRQRLAQAYIEVELFRLHNARTSSRLARGEELGAESSLVKLFWAGATQRMYETAMAVLGPGALDEGPWASGLLATRANSIQGGTSEIQRTIIGERLLGLPREPRVA